MTQGPDTSTTPEMSADDANIVQEVVQESIQKPYHLDDLAARLAEFLLTHLVNEDTRPKFLSNTLDLLAEVNTAIIIGLEKHIFDDHPSCIEMPAFLSDVKASQVSELSRLTTQGMDEILTVIREKYRELLMYKFVFTPENIKEYAGLPESHLQILIDGYFILSSPGNESKGLEDYPSFEDYLTMITPKVLKATQGMELESAADLIPYIPSPLISRYSQMPVPPRVLEMISVKIWPAWQAANPFTPLSPREALTLIYSLYNRFADDKQDDEATVTLKAIRKLGFKKELGSQMLKERRVTSECFQAFRDKYVGDETFVVPMFLGQRDCNFRSITGNAIWCHIFRSITGNAIRYCNFRSITGNAIGYCLGDVEMNIVSGYRLVLGLCNHTRANVLKIPVLNKLVFDETVTQQSYQFLFDLNSAVKITRSHYLSFDASVHEHLQKSERERDIKLLDLALRDKNGSIRFPKVLAKRFAETKFTKEFIGMLANLAPNTFVCVIEGLPYFEPCLALAQNLCSSFPAVGQCLDLVKNPLWIKKVHDHLQGSEVKANLKLLDWFLEISPEGTDNLEVLRHRFCGKKSSQENLSKEFIVALETLAPKTFEQMLKGLHLYNLDPVTAQLLGASVRLVKKDCGRGKVAELVDRFVTDPSIKFLSEIDILYDLREEAGEYLINRRYFDRVARAVIHKGLADLLEPASRYIKEYCLARRSSALADYGHYIENQVFEADLNKEFITKFRTDYPWVFHV